MNKQFEQWIKAENYLYDDKSDKYISWDYQYRYTKDELYSEYLKTNKPIEAADNGILAILDKKDKQLSQHYDLQNEFRKGFLLAEDIVKKWVSECETTKMEKVDFVKASEAFEFWVATADLDGKPLRTIPIKAFNFMTYLWYFFEDKYGQCYQNRDEFVAHYNSGEVKVPFADIETLYVQYKAQKPEVLPSLYQKGDKVMFSVVDKYHTVASSNLAGTVIAVHFYHDKVKYDLEIPIYDEPPTRIYNIDSKFVHPVESSIDCSKRDW